MSGMQENYTIGRLARAAGVPTSTVRYWERRGLLRHDRRTAGDYRVYGGEALERLRFIRAAQENGFTLEDILTLLRFREGKTEPCKEVQDLIQARLADLDRKLRELRHLQGSLRSSLADCRQGEAASRCRVLDRLGAVAATPTVSAPGRRGRKKT